MYHAACPFDTARAEARQPTTFAFEMCISSQMCVRSKTGRFFLKRVTVHKTERSYDALPPAGPRAGN
eukprot:scaffold931_cov383-Prasinococcus_capsulatus_cf.AAC.28